MCLVHVTVAEDDIVVAFIHAALRILAELVESVAQSGFALCTLKEYGQFDRVETLVTDVAEDIQLGVVQDGMGQTHHLAVGLVGREDAGAHASDILGERHHQFLTDGVDGRVGYLGKLLAEIVEENLGLVGEHGQRGVVTHGCGWLLGLGRHGYDGAVDILFAIAEHHFVFYQVGHGILHLASALQFLQLDAVGREPLAVRMGSGKALLDFSVIIDLAFLGVNQQNLAGLQTALLGNLSGVEVHDTHLTGHYHHVVLGDGVTGGAQTVAVEHTAGISAVAEKQGCRTVPRLHQDGVVFVESLEVFGDGVLVVEALGHHHAHGMGQGETAHDKELEHVVEAGRVAHARLHDG